MPLAQSITGWFEGQFLRAVDAVDIELLNPGVVQHADGFVYYLAEGNLMRPPRITALVFFLFQVVDKLYGIGREAERFYLTVKAASSHAPQLRHPLIIFYVNKSY